MSKFAEFTLRHASNNVVVQDGLDSYAIRGGGTEVWAATTGENLSRLQVEISDADVIAAAKVAVLAAAPLDGTGADSVGTAATSGLTYTDAALRELRLHVAFLAPERTVFVRGAMPVVQANPWTDAEQVAYLWDALKMALSTGG